MEELRRLEEIQEETATNSAAQSQRQSQAQSQAQSHAPSTPPTPTQGHPRLARVLGGASYRPHRRTSPYNNRTETDDEGKTGTEDTEGTGGKTETESEGEGGGEGENEMDEEKAAELRQLRLPPNACPNPYPNPILTLTNRQLTLINNP